jgi:hypothetical protein
MKEKEKEELVKKIEEILHKNGMRSAKLIFEEDNLPTVEQIQNEKNWKVEILNKLADRALVQIKNTAFTILIWVVMSLTGVEKINFTLPISGVKKKFMNLYKRHHSISIKLHTTQRNI